MNLTRPSPTPARYAGIGLVVALHLAGIYALSAGLIQPLTRPKEPMVLLPPIPKQIEPQPPQEPLKASKPTIAQVPMPDVPAPPTWHDAPTITAELLRADTPPLVGTPSGTGAPATTILHVAPTEPVVRTAGAVCSFMPKPEVPAVNWSGEAVLQVLATVKGGRVVGSDVRVAQGALDGKTRRSLQRSVESALAGYQCQGDATFQQDFAFRLD